MNLADVRSHVRTTVDLDTTELPNSYLDTIIREANDNIMSRSRVWPWLEQLWTFTATPGQQTYQVASIQPSGTEVSEIASIVDTTAGGFDLDPIEHDFAEEVWRNSLLVSGIPTHWSQWAGTIYLWPKPSTQRTFRVRSYRKPNDWITSNGDIDMDVRLHSTLALYSLSRVYAFQEEPTFASQYMQLFENQLSRVMAEIFRTPSYQLVLNRGFRVPDLRGWEQSLYGLSYP
jgi:hypothetical protein